MDLGAFVFTAIVGYLLGSIPTGYIVGKARGVDLRTVGSGNIGATNVFRTLGKRLGILVLVVDGLKGYAACAWVPDMVIRYLTNKYGPGDPRMYDAIRIAGGVSAVLGHNYTCWLKFKGGKGIATSAGMLAALVPLAFVIVLGIWIVMFAVTRYVSVASIVGSAALPFAAYFTRNSGTIVAVTALMAALAVYKHRSNIQRLLAGTESRFGRKPKEQQP